MLDASAANGELTLSANDVELMHATSDTVLTDGRVANAEKKGPP